MSKRSKACEISPKTKEIVWERDNHKCVICGKYVTVACANAHYIKRSQGGLGIEQNIVTLCLKCHYEEDFGKDTKLYEEMIKKHLKGHYGSSWNISDLIYKKY